MRRKLDAGSSKRALWHHKPVRTPYEFFFRSIETLTKPFVAGVIHGDFERGFIKAEVVAYQDFFDLCEGGKSMGPIKAAGKFRQEGKTYV